MTEQEANELLRRYKKNQCTEAEKALVDDWLSQYIDPDFRDDAEINERIGIEIYKHLPTPASGAKKFNLWPLITAVAASLIIIGTWLFNPLQYTSVYDQKVKDDIRPGGNRATLTLSNGKVINLSAAQKGVIIQSDKLTYSDGTQIVNQSGNGYNGEGTQTISTPKGGQYEIVLPDGTKVWLNAATTLQFSANLKRERGERKVRLESGEAYFEVFKDKKHPFVVTTGQQDVVVLGTHFNINGYTSETKTTLLEGSVRIKALGQSKTITLKPGEQAMLDNGDILVKKADLDLETAWRNGKTEFRDADLKTVMGMLERWYNIETIYPTKLPDAKFSGSVSRNRNISELLELLESTGEVHFKIKGRRIEILR